MDSAVRRIAQLLIVAGLCVSPLLAQGHGFSSRATPGFARSSPVHPGFAPAGRSGFAVSRNSLDRFHGRGFARSGYFYGGAPYYDWGYPDYEYASYENATPPPPAPEPVRQLNQQPLPSPALLELQGNQWVKVNNFTMPASAGGPTDTQAAKEMPPTVIVFRDGRTEELTNYTIIDGAIHTKADYWSSGAWTRSIQIADLDVPATLKQNQERGVKFELPSGPNEVMIRP